MRFCWLGVHRWTQWCAPRNQIQSRHCIHCNKYERVQVLVTLTTEPVDTFDLVELDDDN